MGFFSIAIPTYEMSGKGVEFLEYNFIKFSTQSFKDFEVVISDHSLNDDIYNLCKEWGDKLNIKYLKNEEKRGSSSANINNALQNCSGKWIKILFQDDYLYDYDSLEDIYKFINENNPNWIATACEHSVDGINYYRTFYPKWNNEIVLGNNTISSPSVITIKNNNDNIIFDEQLIWLMDVDFYQRKYNLYGEPNYLFKINVVNRTWGNRLSDTISEVIKNKEYSIIKNKYNL
jgi:hypothetical protein